MATRLWVEGLAVIREKYYMQICPVSDGKISHYGPRFNLRYLNGLLSTAMVDSIITFWLMN